MITVPTYLSIAQTAKLGFISEYHLRRMVKDGKCPGFYAGKKYKVNVDELVEKLNSKKMLAESN